MSAKRCLVPPSELNAPLVLEGALKSLDWPALGWAGEGGLKVLRREHGHRLVSLRFAPRPAVSSTSGGRTPWEGLCDRVDDVPLGEFCAWLAGETSELSRFPRRSFWGYCAYQHFERLFSDLEETNRSAADFAKLLPDGLAPSTLGAPTLWLGSEGACTPCHQDAYGSNLVAQLAGEKVWLLFPPSAAGQLQAQRLPYEDATTFTALDPLGPGLVPSGCAAYRVVLKPWDVLVVPRHWFHAVECASAWSLSLNQWLDASEDAMQRVHEAVTRCLVTPLLLERPEPWWLNPDEELQDTSGDLEYLASAVQEAAECTSTPLDTDQVREALLRAASKPEVVAAIVESVLTDFRPVERPAAARSRRSRSRSTQRVLDPTH